MNDEPRPSVQLTRTDLDRVIRRAVELQFEEGTEDGGTLSEDEVLRIGREVGLAPGHVRRALGEIRAESMVPQLPPDTGLLRKLIGAGRIRADRVVPGDAEEVEGLLVKWLPEMESLTAVRRRAGVSLWEPAEGFLAQLQRGLKWGGQRYELAQAQQVEVTVQMLEEGFSLVTLSVDVRRLRMEQGGGAMFGFAIGGGVLAGGVAATLLPAVGIAGAALVGAGLCGLGGTAVGRTTFGQKIERMRLAAEGLLDRLERGELVPPKKLRRNFSPPGS